MQPQAKSNREHAVNEILQTEVTYINLLEIMYDVCPNSNNLFFITVIHYFSPFPLKNYYLPLLNSYKMQVEYENNLDYFILNGEDIQKIFSNLDMIIPVNKILHSEIAERLENWSESSCIGDIFLKMVKKIFFSFFHWSKK